MKKNSRIGYRWSKDEIQFLKSHYQKLSLSEIAFALHRNRKGVKAKATRLNLYFLAIRNIKLLDLKEIEKAYLAAFIDGEGCISMSITYKNNRPDCPKPIIEISNSNKAIIDWIARKINCGRWKSKNPYKHPENRYQKFRWHYHLSISGRLRIEPFLRSILPYLRIKKILAKKVLAFYKLHRFQNLTTKDWKRVLEIKELVNSQKLPHIRSRERLAQFIKELELKT